MYYHGMREDTHFGKVADLMIDVSTDQSVWNLYTVFWKEKYSFLCEQVWISYRGVLEWKKSGHEYAIGFCRWWKWRNVSFSEENVWLGMKIRGWRGVILTLLEPCMSSDHTPPAVRSLDFERCRCISLTYTAFQEADGAGKARKRWQYRFALRDFRGSAGEFCTAFISTFFGPFFLARKKARKIRERSEFESV